MPETTTHVEWGVVPLIALFSLFFVPVGISGVSVNYSFVLLPVALILATQRLLKPPPWVLAGMFLYALIFALATLYYVRLDEPPFRRAVSFVIFMSLFAFTFVRIRPLMVRAFKEALLLVSVFFSALSVSKFLGLAAMGPLHFEAKSLIGSQRFGFIYVAAFWIALLEPARSKPRKLINYGFVGVITAGVLLTFSRSSLIALLASTLLYAVVQLARGLRRPSLAYWWKFLAGVTAVAAVVVFVSYQFPLTIEFYSYTLLRTSLDGSLLEALSIGGSSEGQRVVRIAEGIDYVMRHPFLGTGFMGIWAFSPTGAGSAHNQLLDTFIRVGLFGFVFYLYLLFSVMKFLGRSDRSLFWGMVGVLIYGVFHETFKESQGAFLLSFLLGMTVQHWRDRLAHPVARIPRPALAWSRAQAGAGSVASSRWSA